jgi:vacuolar protein sorting-associated protein VTA1
MSILAPIKAYFKYSMELKQHVPVVAYYCKLYAVQKGFDLMKQNAANPNVGEVKAYLGNELKDLEQMKAALGQTTKEEHHPLVENFILSVFAKIDKEDRTDEQITKNHALSFKRCADFIQILTMFGPIPEEWAERLKYCNFKAGIILKCLKTGEEPPRGNPFVKEEEEVPQVN